MAGPSRAIGPRVRVRIRPGEENQGETQPGMARQGHGDEEAACGSRPGSQAHGRAQFSSRSGKAWAPAARPQRGRHSTQGPDKIIQY